MKHLLTLAAVVILGVVYCIQHLSTPALERERDLYQAARTDLAALRAENERLRGQRKALVQRATELPSESKYAIDDVSSPVGNSVHAIQSTFASGAWVPANAWKNCGQADPAAAIETMLWAAAGGDVSTLGKVLLLDDATRDAAQTLLARLPATARRFRGPDQLVAAFTSKALPIGPARLDLQESASDRYNAYLAVKYVEQSSLATVSEPTEGAAERHPPRLPDLGPMMIRSLALRRTADGWHIVVPPAAIAKIAQELGISP